MSTDLMELASRVEAGEGPDRELDADIQDAVRLGGYKADRDGCSGRLCGTMTRMASNGDGVEWKPLPAFTASTDAAMTLVPEGWAIDKISMWPAAPEGASNATAPQSHVHMVGTSLDRMGRKMVWGHSGKDGRVEATSTTPAKALTAAALRARAHQGAAHVDQ